MLDAKALTVAQLCPRRWRLEATEPRGKWHVKSLFDAVLRGAIWSLSCGVAKESVAREATTHFRAIAKSPGLDTPHDPWTLAQDHCACLETIVEALSRLTLLTLAAGPTVTIGDGLEWRVSAFADESGVLHRWVTVERADADALSRELHSWHVYGDMAATQAPLTLHLIEIGSVRAGRRHSPWCKTFRQGAVAGVYRFRAKTGRPLRGDWKPVWYGPSQDPSKWVDLMESDGLKLIHHLDVKQLDGRAVEDFKRQIGAEARRLEALGPWREIPMSRPACDTPYVCPWQYLCYSSSG